jgi:hypothetical protein
MALISVTEEMSSGHFDKVAAGALLREDVRVKDRSELGSCLVVAVGLCACTPAAPLEVESATLEDIHAVPSPAPIEALAAIPLTWQAEAEHRIARSRYALRSDGSRFRAESSSQGFAASFDARGVELRRQSGQASPLRIEGRTIARGEKSTPLPNAKLALGACTADGALDLEGMCLKRLEGTRGAVTELWENREDGLEHSFVVKAKLPGQGELSVFVAVTGADVEIDSDLRSARLVTREDGASMSYSGLRAWDASGKDLPARMSAKIGGLALVVDDTDATYPVTIDPLVSGFPGWQKAGSSAFGEVMASAGDVNGDGFDDVIIGETSYDHFSGKALVFLGTASGLADTPAWSATGSDSTIFFGASVAGAGDVNGDGFDDVVVSVAFEDFGSGQAFLYLGNPNGLGTTPAWTLESDSGFELDTVVAGAGDVNGDGFDDVLVGVPEYSSDTAAGGAVFVYLGRSSGLAADPAWTVANDTAAALFGVAVASAGDINGDGFDDVVVGAPGFRGGAAFVYSGGAAGLQTTPRWTIATKEAGARLGAAVASAGDVNNDGFSDLLVGAGAASTVGKISLYLGGSSASSPKARWTLAGNAGETGFGLNLAGAGDLDADGFDDVIIGSASYDSPAIANRGHILAYLGNAGGLGAGAAWMLEGIQAETRLGRSVAGAGDFNADGFADVLVADPNNNIGRVAAFASPLASVKREGDQANAAFGGAVASAGDVNGDGFSDVIVGAHLYDNGQTDEGRAFVYHGSASGLAVSPAWTAESNQAGAHFGASVASAGDVNGDGFDDVIVGAPTYDDGQTDEGLVYVYMGGANGVSSAAAWTRQNNQVGAQFGSSVATAGDVNNDGFADVIIGSPYYDTGTGLDVGRVTLFHGSASGLSSTLLPNWFRNGTQAGALLGSSVAGAGDVNADGFDDVIVGEPAYDNAFVDAGRAWVFMGGSAGVTATVLWSWEHRETASLGGYSVAGAGDVNRDGFDDVIIGAPQALANDEGIAVVFGGSASGISNRILLDVQGTQPGAHLGNSVASAGDVDGDGSDEVIVGSEKCANGASAMAGAALVYRSAFSSLGPYWARWGDQNNAGLGHAVAGAGDVNGDGLADVIIGAPLHDNGLVDRGRIIVTE